MAFHLLERNRDGGRALARALEEAAANVVHCRRCRMLTDGELCEICAAPRRDATSLCIVESPADVVAVEQSGGYGGRYFVLMGHLSPLDGIGPEQLGFDRLEALLDEGRDPRGDPRDQPDGRGRGDRALHRRARVARAASAPRALRTACRSAANSSTWTAARWRTRSPGARSSPEVRRRAGRHRFCEREQPPVALEAARRNQSFLAGRGHGTAGLARCRQSRKRQPAAMAAISR